MLLILAYLGGVLTIVSPCILPVLPFVFARADRSFLGSGLPLLIGMAASFATVASLAAVGGGWAVDVNEYGRLAAIAILALLGVTLLFPQLSERLSRPVVALGVALSRSAELDVDRRGSSVPSSLLLGAATGLLWAPCAGPILGLILTGAVLQGPNIQTSLLLVAYAAGAATSLAAALLLGGRVFAAMKRSLGTTDAVRRGLGAAVLVAVAAIGLGADADLLSRVATGGATAIERGLVDRLHRTQAAPMSANMSDAPAVTSPVQAPQQAALGKIALAPSTAIDGRFGDDAFSVMTPAVMKAGDPAMMRLISPSAGERLAAAGSDRLPVEGTMPSLGGAVAWLNSPELTPAALKGKVVVVAFWTYGCINCLNVLPYVRTWAAKYRDQGLVVVGVHTPEFPFEKKLDNVRKAISDLKIEHPVAVDNNYVIWRAFKNQYWPAHYFIDAQGRIRYHHFGEGDYEGSERVIQQLLAEAGRAGLDGRRAVEANARGVEAR